MMEHANLHLLQDGQLEPSSSSSSTSSLTSTAPSSYGGAAGSTHIGWTQNFNLNTNSFNPNCDGFNSSMIQHLNPHNWHTNNVEGRFTSQLSSHEDMLNLARIKEELSETNFPKFTDMLSTNSPSSIGDSNDISYMKSNEPNDIADLTEKLLLKTITGPAGFPLNGYHQYPGGGGGSIFSTGTRDCSGAGMGGFPGRSRSISQIYPSINISNLKQTNLPSLSSFDMNSEALDLLNSTRFGGRFGHDSLSPYSTSPSLRFDQMQSSPRSSSSPSQIPSSPFSNETTSEPKRSRSSGESGSRPTQAAATKKTRVDPRSTCPPLKVRKEKLGDRVATLQQLVAPFGKTDTASVLMEAIGYIKFLQNQVETLSVPYMKSSRNKNNRSAHLGLGGGEDGNEETRRDLRSRGLCLVPLSCMSYMTNIDGGRDIWPPPPNFGGGT